ncbi:MAG TPA: xanthine dehydrogenase family protein subunit M [Candidatus Limnocylindrales bacterium]|nr:xanthine dehydrogenase family protein subunit M [Candidatus Limnocylindrales bacterium]
MYPAAFEYLAPTNLQQAVEFIAQRGEDARILAGGQSLIPLMKLRLARPKFLIDLNHVAGLNHIEERDGCLVIGALARHADIESSPLLRAKIPLIGEAVRLLGDYQVRNLGTIGGALVEADPAGDWGPVILALNGRVLCLGPAGEREIKASDFFTSAYSTAIQSNELVKEIVIPLPRQPALSKYIKLERIAGDFAVASVALQADIDNDGICRDIGIGLGGAGECPLKATTVEALLRGHKPSAELIERAGREIQEFASPIGDLRGSAEYKKEVLKVIFGRALEQVIKHRSPL